MAIRLTDQDYMELAAQAQQVHRVSEFCLQHGPPAIFGVGQTLHIRLRDGLAIDIIQGQLQQPLQIIKGHSEQFPLTAKFYLSGTSRVKAKHVPESLADYEEAGGHSYLYWLPEMSEVEEWQPHKYTQMVMVYANLEYFQTFSATNNGLPRSLQSLTQAGRFHQPMGKMTLAMNQVVRQILGCPYQGVTQQIYLECKALELIALQFSDLEADATISNPSRLSAEDLDRVQYARELLVQHLENPPSPIALSHRVGLSSRKLKQGFQALFGTTVFGYLGSYRMEQAKLLLRQSNVTVAEVAAQVGYRNPEAFSTAFRRKFAVSPKAYQLNQRR
ncbi:MAG: AraC family transcriptional regulator [Cyanobacteria bacterium P01_H01_bin.119]